MIGMTITQISEAAERAFMRMADRYWSDIPATGDVADAEREVFEEAYTATPGLIYEAIPEGIEKAEEASLIAAMLKGDHTEVGRIVSAIARRYALSVYADRIEKKLNPKAENAL